MENLTNPVALSDTRTGPRLSATTGAKRSVAPHTLETRQGVWHPVHRVETHDGAFAHSLFERVKSVDLEPDLLVLENGAFAVEFVATQSDRDAAIAGSLR